MCISGISGSYSSSVFNALSHLHTDFHSGCISLHLEDVRIGLNHETMWEIIRREKRDPELCGVGEQEITCDTRVYRRLWGMGIGKERGGREATKIIIKLCLKAAVMKPGSSYTDSKKGVESRLGRDEPIRSMNKVGGGDF